jgi:type IV secretory pathway TraG/TraD family ATPase VirD4
MATGTIANMYHPGWTATQLLKDPDLYEHYAPFYNKMRLGNPGLPLGTFRNPYRNGEPVNLIDDGDRFVMISLPTREGKGTQLAIPAGFCFNHGMWATDPRTETLGAMGYYRRHIMGQIIAAINPFDTTHTSTRWNPQDELRGKTVYEVQDALNNATACLDGATEIILANQGTMTIADMARRHERDGETFSVYGFDLRKGEHTIAHAKRAIRQQHQKRCVAVTLSNDDTINASYDHPFLTLEGAYVWAEALTPGMLLRSYTDRFAPVVKVLTIVPAGMRDVYDLTVETFHNFALAAGPYTHNTCDPDGDGMSGESGTWRKRARDIASALMLHMCWAPEIKEKSFRTLINMLTMPGESTEEAGAMLKERLTRIRDYPHDPNKIYGFRDGAGNPTVHHPYVYSCLDQQIQRPPNEGGSVISELLTSFGVYRDRVFGDNTSVSDVCVEDFMHGLLPATLAYQVSPANFEVGRNYTRLLLNMLINKNLREVTPGERPFNWRFALVLDEFTGLGKLSLLVRQFAYIAAAGFRVYLLLQDMGRQLSDVYSAQQQVTQSMHAIIMGPMNEESTAKTWSDAFGKTTIGYYKYGTQLDSKNSRRITTNEEVQGFPFIDINEFMNDIPNDEAILKLASRKPVPIKRLPYYEDSSKLRERVAIWQKRNQLPDRIPRELQTINRDRAKLEREYVDYCRRSSEDLQFDAAQLRFNTSQAARAVAIDDCLASLRDEWSQGAA